MLQRSRAHLRHNVALLLADPAPIVLLTLMPLVMMAFLAGTGEAVLRAQGRTEASGAEIVVPGMAVLFAFFGVGFIGTAFFSEHEWRTWDRLLAGAGATEIMLGKVVPSTIIMLGQLVVLFVAGVALFGMRIHGSLVGVAIMMLASTVFLAALAMLCTALLRTTNQLMSVVNLGALVLGGIGGAIAPTSVLPGWAQALAPASPAYWMLRGFNAVVLDSGGAGSTIGPALAVLAFATAAGLIAAWRFRFADAKTGDGHGG